MRLYLDTSIIMQDPWFTGLSAQILKQACGPLGIWPRLPKIVADEAANVLQRRIGDALAAHKKALRDLTRWLNMDVRNVINDEVLDASVATPARDLTVGFYIWGPATP